MEKRRTLSIGITVNIGNYENLHLEVSDAVETKEDAAGLRRFLADVLNDFAANNATAKQAIDKYKERILDDAASSENDARAKSAFEDYPLDIDTSFDEDNLPVLTPDLEPVPLSVPIPPAAALEEPENENPLKNVTEAETSDSEPAEIEITETKNETEIPETVTPPEPLKSADTEPVPYFNVENEVTDAKHTIENKRDAPKPPKTEPEQQPKPASKNEPHAPQTPAEELFTCEKCGKQITKVQAQVSKLFSGKNLCQDCFNGIKK